MAGSGGSLKRACTLPSFLVRVAAKSSKFLVRERNAKVRTGRWSGPRGWAALEALVDREAPALASDLRVRVVGQGDREGVDIVTISPNNQNPTSKHNKVCPSAHPLFASPTSTLTFGHEGGDGDRECWPLVRPSASTVIAASSENECHQNFGLCTRFFKVSWGQQSGSNV